MTAGILKGHRSDIPPYINLCFVDKKSKNIFLSTKKVKIAENLTLI
jgi:hypothetical protein